LTKAKLVKITHIFVDNIIDLCCLLPDILLELKINEEAYSG